VEPGQPGRIAIDFADDEDLARIAKVLLG